MKSLIQFIIEAGGAEAGKLEIANTSLNTAVTYASRLFDDNGMDLYDEIPDFDFNYELAQRKSTMGWTRRKDMPVISSSDLKQFQKRLANGELDVVLNPRANSTNPKNPFPQGLSGSEARDWLNAGMHDGYIPDDKVDVKMTKVRVKNLNPIQKQIYFDKSIKGISKNGADKSRNFYTDTVLIASADNYIIDGHHRFLGSILLDPEMKVNVLSIDLPIKKLLPLSLAYSDAIGNKRNK
ncbi:MAG: hypothetical protein CL489_08260 [Acidobacteria bacterium]|nr:hypothetical protein [Acidobacteriota bacterium]|tara:strand:+ start:11704 stop:12417 length:714 start_codon:yes stop_codon:yes gene_type:complete